MLKQEWWRGGVQKRNRLCSNDKTGGEDGREIKLKELKHEGHIALGK
jgi:hypothetical protein